MRQLLILAACGFCIFTAQAEEDYATIVRYLGENGHFIISPSDVAKVQAFMKEHGYQHVSDIPKGSFAAGVNPEDSPLSPSKMDTGDPVAQPSATEAVSSSKAQTSAPEGEPPSRPVVTHIVVPSATPEPSSTRGFGPIFLTVVIGTYCLPLLVASSRRHRQTIPLAILNVAFGWTVIGWILCLAWAFARGKE
jgi:Superinfection immunity protein